MIGMKPETIEALNRLESLYHLTNDIGKRFFVATQDKSFAAQEIAQLAIEKRKAEVDLLAAVENLLRLLSAEGFRSVTDIQPSLS